MGGLIGMGNAHALSDFLSPCSPTTYVFLSLLAIVICFITIPDIGTDLAWPLVIVFAILAMSPDRVVEE